MSPETHRKLGEIRANPPERSSGDAYAQMDAALAYSRSLGEPHPYEGDGPECALCLRGRGARRHGLAGGWR